jgi:hypothetical protein
MSVYTGDRQRISFPWQKAIAAPDAIAGIRYNTSNGWHDVAAKEKIFVSPSQSSSSSSRSAMSSGEFKHIMISAWLDIAVLKIWRHDRNNCARHSKYDSRDRKQFEIDWKLTSNGMILIFG